MMKTRIIAILGAGLLALSACTVPPAISTPAPAPTTVVEPTAAPTEVAAAPAPLAWKRCSEQLPAELECAQIQAPMDYTAPDGPTITLTMTSLKATDPEKRIGSLIINPGGPGGAGSDILIAAGGERLAHHAQTARVL